MVNSWPDSFRSGSSGDISDNDSDVDDGEVRVDGYSNGGCSGFIEPSEIWTVSNGSSRSEMDGDSIGYESEEVSDESDSFGCSTSLNDGSVGFRGLGVDRYSHRDMSTSVGTSRISMVSRVSYKCEVNGYSVGQGFGTIGDSSDSFEGSDSSDVYSGIDHGGSRATDVDGGYVDGGFRFNGYSVGHRCGVVGGRLGSFGGFGPSVNDSSIYDCDSYISEIYSDCVDGPSNSGVITDSPGFLGSRSSDGRPRV